MKHKCSYRGAYVKNLKRNILGGLVSCEHGSCKDCYYKNKKSTKQSVAYKREQLKKKMKGE